MGTLESKIIDAAETKKTYLRKISENAGVKDVEAAGAVAKQAAKALVDCIVGESPSCPKCDARPFGLVHMKATWGDEPATEPKEVEIGCLACQDHRARVVFVRNSETTLTILRGAWVDGCQSFRDGKSSVYVDEFGKERVVFEGWYVSDKWKKKP